MRWADGSAKRSGPPPQGQWATWPGRTSTRSCDIELKRRAPAGRGEIEEGGSRETTRGGSRTSHSTPPRPRGQGPGRPERRCRHSRHLPSTRAWRGRGGRPGIGCSTVAPPEVNLGNSSGGDNLEPPEEAQTCPSGLQHSDRPLLLDHPEGPDRVAVAYPSRSNRIVSIILVLFFSTSNPPQSSPDCQE